MMSVEITNHSTGYLGKEIAELFLAKGHQVTLVTVKTAVKPEPKENLKITEITNVDSLLKVWSHLSRSTMSSSIVWLSLTILQFIWRISLSWKIRKTPANSYISLTLKARYLSASDYQVLFLKKTPKIISLVKQWNPNIQLVGFKLLANVSKEDLFKAARASLKRNQANIIVANDLGEITPNQHIAYLVDEKGEEMVTTKSAIAQALYERICYD